MTNQLDSSHLYSNASSWYFSLYSMRAACGQRWAGNARQIGGKCKSDTLLIKRETSMRASASRGCAKAAHGCGALVTQGREGRAPFFVSPFYQRGTVRFAIQYWQKQSKIYQSGDVGFIRKSGPDPPPLSPQPAAAS